MHYCAFSQDRCVSKHHILRKISQDAFCFLADVSPAVRERRANEASAVAPSHSVAPDTHIQTYTHTKKHTGQPNKGRSGAQRKRESTG